MNSWSNRGQPPPIQGNDAMFEKRSDLVRFLAVAEAGRIGLAAERLIMTQPALTRIVARLERRFGGRLFERLPQGVRLTALGVTATERARRILREYAAAEHEIDAARSGRTGAFRVTANPVWSEVVVVHAAARFHEVFPAIELDLETTTRAEGLRRLADGESDLHVGGIDLGQRLPDFLRRERFLDMTAGIVAARGHPLFAGQVTAKELARSPWVDFDQPMTAAAASDARPSLAALLERLHDTTHTRVKTILRTGTVGLLVMAAGPYLAWLSLDFLERLPGAFLRPLPVELGRYPYRSGFVARRSAEDMAPFRRLEEIVRETALERPE